jgi:2,4-dienoyl-CoA reductase-like NADH-dependent reductase (Old Yellow Enzyme family)
MTSFSSLFMPGTIGTLQLENRLVMAAMGTRLASAEGKVTERLLDYYRARARGGVGLVIPQCALVSADSKVPYMLDICDDTSVSDWSKLVDAVHEAGSKVCIQLMHMGLLFLEARALPQGIEIKVPSMLPWLEANRPYRVLNAQEIERYTDDFAEAARRARQAGADAVELHACHGCLVGTFLSPATNHRRDQYGGNVEDRTLFARNIIRRIRHKVGTEFPVWVRINVVDDVEGGVTLGEASQQARILVSAGANAISLSAGLEYWSPLTIPCYAFTDGPLLALAAAVRRAVAVPVIVAGKMSPELAALSVTDGRVDYVAMGRPLLADPDLPKKLREGRVEEVRRCIYCNNCLGRDPREQSHELGGQWKTASCSPGKAHYAWLTDYLEHYLRTHDVSIMLGKKVQKESVVAERPDVAVVATGASPTTLAVPGADGRNVVQAHDVLRAREPVGHRFAVVGGRFVGMEVAIWLAQKGKEVSLISRAGLGQNGSNLEKRTFQTLARRLIELRVPLYLHAAILEIKQHAVMTALGDQVFAIPADKVILAVGMQPENGLGQELQGVVGEVHMVGDCVRPRDAAEVAYQAAMLASSI